MQVVVQDDGIGFEQKGHKCTSLGMISMKERVDILEQLVPLLAGEQEKVQLTDSNFLYLKRLKKFYMFRKSQP